MFAEITVDEVASWLARGAQIVDVREAWEYVGGHLPGAVSIPLGEALGRLDELRAPVVLVCATGVRSGRLAEHLERVAFGEVANLLGGTVAWRESGRAVVAGAEPGAAVGE